MHTVTHDFLFFLWAVIKGMLYASACGILLFVLWEIILIPRDRPMWERKPRPRPNVMP